MLPFISSDDLSAYLDTTVTGGELIVEIALDGACEAVRREMDRVLNLTVEEDIVLDGNWTNALVLPQRPVHEVKAMSVTLDDEAVDDADLYLEVDRGVLFLTDGTYWTWGKGNVALTYTHGYAIEEVDVAGTIVRVPSNIRLVALRLAAAIYRSKGSTTAASGAALTGEHIGTYEYTQDAAAATEMASILITDDDRKMLSSQRAVFAA